MVVGRRDGLRASTVEELATRELVLHGAAAGARAASARLERACRKYVARSNAEEIGGSSSGGGASQTTNTITREHGTLFANAEGPLTQ